MNFQDWGEEGFIQYLAKLFSQKGPIRGIGDDCAIIPDDKGTATLVTTDTLIEGIHFLKAQIPPKALGYKTIAVNVSDIAAMGGTPQYAFLSTALPRTTEAGWAKELAAGIKEACDKWHILLLGGDTVGSKRDIFLNLTLIGQAEAHKIKYRHTAQVGDIICVTGFLGEAAAGLKVLQNGLPETPEIKHLIHKHFHPEPDPAQGRWLAAHEEVHAMMDLSDGLDADLNKLLKSSNKGAKIEISKLPFSAELTRLCAKQAWDALELAVAGGEEYCLLLTIRKKAFETIQEAFTKNFQKPLYDIGTIVESPSKIHYQKQGKPFQIKGQSFDHFQ